MAAHSHAQLYYKIYFTLLGLVVATVVAAFIPMGLLAVPVMLTIASTKAALIVYYFMHVNDETPLVRVFALSGFFWLFLLFSFTFSDYLTRNKMTDRIEPPPVIFENDSHDEPAAESH